MAGRALLPRVLRPVVYHGHMGEALFKPVVRLAAESTHDSAAALLPLALPFAVTGLALTLEWPLAWALVAAALASVLAYGAAIAAMTDVDRDESRPVALRTLVGMLHIVQPFARLWGRLTGGRQVRGGSAPVTSIAPAWRGDRLEWLHHLAWELKCNGCTVRPSGPMHVWDLAVSVSVLVRARVTTAVVWQWEPRHRVRYAPLDMVGRRGSGGDPRGDREAGRHRRPCRGPARHAG